MRAYKENSKLILSLFWAVSAFFSHYCYANDSTNVKTSVNSLPHIASKPVKKHWSITNLKNGFTYDTSTQLMTVKGLQKKGLISVAKKGENLLINYWQEGAYRSTITYNKEKLVDGFALDDVSRVTSFRFDKHGNFVYIRTAKGPKAKVKLIFNNELLLTWPRLSKIKILAFKGTEMIISKYDEDLQQTSFIRYQLNSSKNSIDSQQYLGKVDGCDVLSTKAVSAGVFIQSYCQVSQGSDIQFLDLTTHQLITTKASQFDEFFGFKYKGENKTKQKYKTKGRKNNTVTIPVLSVSGGVQSRQIYHAISGVFSQYLGEPMSKASDEAGKQSWSQSYRTLTLAELYEKTNHPIFARIATQAMAATLRQQNDKQGIFQAHNPKCAWASRIYSIDGSTPISFMINQAMIANSLIYSCKKLKQHCSEDLKTAIEDNASCLVSSFEYLFVQSQGLYRIPYGSNFRYDGLFAPWNWQLTWAHLLQYVGENKKNSIYQQRSLAMVKQFIASWHFTDEANSRALWRYWPPHYYLGWQEVDKVSIHRPKQRPVIGNKLRYEDLNHAGLSLLGLSFLQYPLTAQQQRGLSHTIDYLLDFGSILPRDMDGKGPLNPRWSLGAGWHAYATPRLTSLFSGKLPGSVSSNKHLAYAFLGKAQNSFNLQFTLSICSYQANSKESEFSCEVKRKWAWRSIDDFLTNNPLFLIKAINKS